MDEIDYEIIRELQKNGRISAKKLADIVSLTPPAVSERIRKLEKEGVILGYKAIINPKKLGRNIKAIINVVLKNGKQEEFLNFAIKNKSIVECNHVTGRFSMTVEVILKDMHELEETVSKIQEYGSTQTLVVLSSLIENKYLFD